MPSAFPGRVADGLLCDLHLHSTHSDGMVSPEQLVVLASRAGMSAMCISDHSRPTFSRRLSDLAAGHGIALLPGLEISTVHNGRKYHVLAYGPGVLDAGFLDFSFRPTAVKNGIYRRVLADLRADGARLPGDDEILAGARDGAEPRHPGKWMFSSTLIGRYLAPVIGSDPASAAAVVKERYNALKGHEADRYVPTERAVALSREIGAIPVIAHPFWECRGGGDDWGTVVGDLRCFAARGLIGMEVSSRHDAPADEQRRAEVARRLALVSFRSSDFHGNGKTEVGQFPMRGEHLVEAGRRCGVEVPLAATAVPPGRRE